MSGFTKIEREDIKYTENGSPVKFVSELDGGGILVQDIYEHGNFNGKVYLAGKDTRVVNEIYDQMPKKLVDELVSRAVKAENAQHRTEENLARLQKSIKESVAFPLLDAFMAGRITHFICKHGDYKILTTEELLKKYQSPKKYGVHLFSVSYDFKGKIKWDMNIGEGRQVWPCESEDEARKTLTEILKQEADQALRGEGQKWKEYSQEAMQKILSSAIRYGLEFPSRPPLLKLFLEKEARKARARANDATVNCMRIDTKMKLLGADPDKYILEN